MRLSKLQIDNLLSHQQTAVEFAKPLIVVLGTNGTGKSSLLHAIELLLDGRVMDLGSQKLEALIQKGHNGSGTVSGMIERDGAKPVQITRMVTGNGVMTEVGGKPSNNGVHDFFMPPGVLAPEAIVRALCNVSGFLDMDSEKQKGLLMSLVDQSIPGEALIGLALDGRVSTPKTFDDLDLAYDKAFEARRDAKAALKAHVVPVVDTKTVVPSLDAIEKRLTSLRADKDELLRRTGANIQQRHSLASERKQLADAADLIEARLGELGKLGMAQSKLKSVQAALVTAKVNAMGYTAGVETIDKLTQAVEVLRIARDELNGLDSACVIGSGLACPLSQKDKDKAVKLWGGLITTKLDAIAAQRQNLGEEPALAPLEAQVESAQTLCETITTSTARLSELTLQVSKLDAKLRDLDTTLDEDKIREIEASIVKGVGVQSNAKELTEGRANLKVAQEQHTKLDADVAEWEKIVKAFGPKGIREKLLIDRMGGLQEQIIATLKPFGLTIGFADEPWAVLVNGVPLSSESERFRAGVALQVALAVITGVKLVLIDGADVLDKANRSALFGLLLGAIKAGSLDQAIVTATLTNEDALNGKYPEQFQLFHMKNTGDFSEMRAV